MLRENRRLDDPGAVGDHRPGRAALLGPPRRRPALRHPSGVDRGGREAGRPGNGRVGAPADLARLPDAPHPPRRPRGTRRPGPRPGRARLRRRLGDRRPRGRDPLGAVRGRPGRLHHRPQRHRPREAGERFRRQRAGPHPRLHRADERLDGRRRRDDPRHRRPDRARGAHPRLPGRLLRLLGRSPAGQQRRLRTLRPGRGGGLQARAGVGPAPRHPRAPLAGLLLRLAALARLARAHRAPAGARRSRSGACARSGWRPLSPSP